MATNDQDFDGQIAWVTGGASGIGEATARTLSEHGARVGIVDIDIEKAAALIEAHGMSAVACDVADQASLESALDSLQADLGAPQILVNAAGVSYGQKVARHDVDGWRRVLDINLTGPFLTTRYVLSGMIERGYGRIVNISSGASVRGSAGSAAYSSSKAGLQALTKSVAYEGAKSGVTCNAVAPGTVDTPLARAFVKPPYQLEDLVRTRDFYNPMEALLKPEDIARAIVFLCRRESRYITGQTQYVNAGGVMV